MKYEIDIDLGPLADEWEPVAFRVPIVGDYVLCGTDHVSQVREPDDFSRVSQRLIVRRRWQWPEWLTAEWIAMDELGGWYAYTDEPRINVSTWGSGSAMCNLALTNFTPPPCTDWKQSKRRNPRSK